MAFDKTENVKGKGNRLRIISPGEGSQSAAAEGIFSSILAETCLRSLCQAKSAFKVLLGLCVRLEQSAWVFWSNLDVCISEPFQKEPTTGIRSQRMQKGARAGFCQCSPGLGEPEADSQSPHSHLTFKPLWHANLDMIMGYSVQNCTARYGLLTFPIHDIITTLIRANFCSDRREDPLLSAYKCVVPKLVVCCLFKRK